MELWYVLYTRPNCEDQVRTVLHNRGIDTFLPEIFTVDKRKARLKTPLFPCYLFMQADLDFLPGSAWRWTPGLRTIVSFDGKPLPMPDQAIDGIRRRLSEINKSGGLPKHPFKRGDVVRIKEGPFADVRAIFDGPTTASERVRVLIHLLGRVNKVSLDIDLLETAPRNARATEPPRLRRTRGRGRKIRFDRTELA